LLSLRVGARRRLLDLVSVVRKEAGSQVTDPQQIGSPADEIAHPEPTLLLRSLAEKGTVLDFGPGQVGIFSTRSPGKTVDNEDAAAVIPFDGHSGILAVADGMGGQPAGATASNLSLEELVRVSRTRADLRATVLNGFEEANRAVSGLGVGAATTLAVVEVNGPAVRPYHAGDSMILLVGQRGLIKHQTISHSPVGYAVEAGLLDEDDALHHEDRHLISNMIGTPEMRIEVGPAMTMAPLDTLLLATDGLFDNLTVPEIVEAIRKGPLERIVQQLVTAALGRMREPAADHPSKPDDLTFIVYRQTRR
jgi:serine/threonine protein phosphatase PrpC